MKKRVYLPVMLLLAGFMGMMTSCKKEEEMDPTLYERLGGIDAIAAVTDKFLANVAGNDEINFFFADAVADPFRLQSLRNHLVDQICEAAGGPCVYKGKSMQEAHAGMNITTEQFNSLVGDLVAALDFYAVPTAEKDELLGILGSLAPDIVGQ